jgi:hypothetical protein
MAVNGKRNRPTNDPASPKKRKRKESILPEPMSFNARIIPKISSYKPQKDEIAPLPLVADLDEQLDQSHYTVSPGKMWDKLRRYKRFTSKISKILNSS